MRYEDAPAVTPGGDRGKPEHRYSSDATDGTGELQVTPLDTLAWYCDRQLHGGGTCLQDRALHVRVKGLAEITGFFAASKRTFSSDSTLQVTDAFETPAHYAVEWVMRGTHDGSSERLPAAGRESEVQGVSVGRLEGGLIVENHDYWDLTDFLAQVGLMPQPAAAGAR